MNAFTSAQRLPARLRLATVAVLVSSSTLACAQTTAPTVTAATVHFQIPAQALDGALAQLARTAGLQLMAPPICFRDVSPTACRGR